MATRSTRAAGDSRTAGGGQGSGQRRHRRRRHLPAPGRRHSGDRRPDPGDQPALACATPTVTATPDMDQGQRGTRRVLARRDTTWSGSRRSPHPAAASPARTGSAPSPRPATPPAPPACSRNTPLPEGSPGRTPSTARARSTCSRQHRTSATVGVQRDLHRPQGKQADRSAERTSVGLDQPQRTPCSGCTAATASAAWPANSIHDWTTPSTTTFPYDTDRAGGPIGSDPDSSGKPALQAPPWRRHDARAGRPDRRAVPRQVGRSGHARTRPRSTPWSRPPGSRATTTTLTGASISLGGRTPNENNAVVFLDFQTHQSGRPQRLQPRFLVAVRAAPPANR